METKEKITTKQIMNSPHFFGITKDKPSRKDAQAWNAQAQKNGGHFVEVNLKTGSAPGINNGRYQGWFEIENFGSPHNERRANEIKDACGI